jgi:L-methionine (R)-S-oxide reductase
MNFETDKILEEIFEIISINKDRETVLEQISRLLKEKVFHYDWVGFYLMDKMKSGLVLGPYTGAHTDHTFISVGKGVCGQVAQNKTTMVVQDVTKMENYLSCSINVQSEIVVPVLKDGEFVAELDIDSHSPAPFTENDTIFLEKICKELAVFFNSIAN